MAPPVAAAVEFNFTDDQTKLVPDQTLTQSYEVTLADAQNPSATQQQIVSVTVGGPGDDHFVFAPGVGADTVMNFNPQHDTIELDYFANVQTVQELQQLVTQDAHGDAVISLGHNDSITFAGTTAPQLQHAPATYCCISSLRKNQEVEPLFSLLRGGGSGAVFDYLVVSRVF